MTRELDENLVNKYSKIFRDRHGDKRMTAMCWGFDIDDGWYWLIDNLCNCIQSYIDNNSKQKRIKNIFARIFIESLWSFRRKLMWSKISIFKKISKLLNYELILKIENKFEKEDCDKIPQVIATQVKEKFGGLRFYYNGGDDKIDGMVWLAEHLSYNICEKCGTTKNIGRTKGWIKTLCEECGKENKNWEKI